LSYTLGANLENLTLTGGVTITGTGNALDNVIIGNGVANTLNGGAGADDLQGGGGNDTYIVENAGDTVTEAAAAGTDHVQSTVSFTLGANVENLTLIGVAVINGTGNSLVNSLIGNGSDNVLDGGTGADTMSGGNGNDTYIVDNAGDVVTEPGSSGTDEVVSSVTYTLTANVENLILSGALATNGTGNILANTITGNAQINVLDGGANGDTLDGGGGGDDLHGGLGNDSLNGGTGIDKFFFETALSAALNVDDILDFSVADDTIFLDRSIFTGIAANGTLAAGAFVNGAAAVDASDRIIYDSATGNIFYDEDGVGGVAQVLFATVVPGTALTNGDFSAFI
jgi:Ca2+-binding RTX toxin-like protein